MPIRSTPSRSCRSRRGAGRLPAVLDIGGGTIRSPAWRRRRFSVAVGSTDVEPDGPAPTRAGTTGSSAQRRRPAVRRRALRRVVACLVFEHIDAVDEAIAEVAGARAGWSLLFFLNHPLLQTPGSGWIDDRMFDPPEQYWRIGPYLPEPATIEEI